MLLSSHHLLSVFQFCCLTVVHARTPVSGTFTFLIAAPEIPAGQDSHINLHAQDKAVLQKSVVNLMLDINQEDASAALEDLEVQPCLDLAVSLHGRRRLAQWRRD